MTEYEKMKNAIHIVSTMFYTDSDGDMVFNQPKEEVEKSLAYLQLINQSR